LPSGCEGDAVTVWYWIGGAVALLLFAYLVVALLAPERFS
jgi:K+-transporting ATPase KdpF subunit